MLTWRYMLDGQTLAPLTDPIWHGPDREPLEIDGPNDVATLDSSAPDLSRYAALLPVEPTRFVTLGAGMTPLVPGKLAGRDVVFKLDSLLPTGSFKDRGAAVSVAHLQTIGVRRVIVDSSGNAAAAMSAYSAALGIECVVYAPATASPGKLVQSRAYGSEVVLVDGSRDDVAAAAQVAANESPDCSYVSHNWSPIFAEGVKTWALEVWEQLGRRSPERVFVPTGGGSALVGANRGFSATGSLPEIVACQPASCAPLVGAFNRGNQNIAAVEPGPTVAEGARISDPPRDAILMDVLEASGGRALAIEEHEILSALTALWRQGIYAEPTAALGAAAFVQTAERGEELVGTNVILITGNGLKTTEAVREILAAEVEPPTR